MTELFKIAISIIPVLLFLVMLVFLDSFKLVKLSRVILSIIVGGVVALLCLLLSLLFLEVLRMNSGIYSRYLAPVMEELLKAVYVIFMIRSKKVGFLVDAAILGFAVGAGFAVVENIYYLQVLDSTNPLLWIVRGFGTALLHGATMTIFAIVSKGLCDRRDSMSVVSFFPGLLLVMVIHSFFNHLPVSPALLTIGLVILLPAFTVAVYNRSEATTREWLGMELDTEMELLDIITSGSITETRIGKHLNQMKTRFPGETVADMLCLLQIHLELTIGAKGILLMKQAGLNLKRDPEIRAKIEELKFLEKSLGTTGRLAIKPFLRTSSRQLWQLYMLNKQT